ncbi:hypothetical protein PsYK624_153830 [Phanerochaete sordida]|uniref:Reverse transcriptase domain-containing protein n=1 Tax=Phanerochaete sordida TaxID=48140 RepID=A0A9P3GQR8_9APHY|nr:hypothetical protein PsYK624_153830 [Phanerochaete sordida]
MALRDASGALITDPARLAALLQEQFTPSAVRTVNELFLADMPIRKPFGRTSVSRMQVLEALELTSNSSAPEPNHVNWFWLKCILRNDNKLRDGDGNVTRDIIPILGKVVALFEVCVRLGMFPWLFKEFRTVVIPKPHKPDYTVPKAYRPIVLLNCLGKLFEKILARQMQALAQAAGVMHPAQFGGMMQHSTMNAGVCLVHNIKEA